MIVLGAFVLIACTCNHHHIYYSPPPQNVPLLREKLEGNLNAGVGTGNVQNIDWLFPQEPQSDCFYYQASFSPRKYIGLASSYTKFNGANSCNDLEGRGRGYMFDIAGGYYRTFDSLGNINNLLHFGKFGKYLVVESYFGIGISGQRHIYRDHSYTGTSELNATYFYLQPAFGINCRWLTLAISTRLNQFYYYDIQTEYPAGYPSSQYTVEEMEFLNYIGTHRSQFFVEPCLTLRLGWRFIKLSAQYGLSHSLNGYRPEVFYDPDRLTIGLSFNLEPRLFRQKD